jgi:DedD protein
MKTMLHDRDFDRNHDEKQDAELTLGIGSLLGIFFGVVLVCGVFFGFGYSIGRHNPPAGASSPISEGDAPPAASGRHARSHPDRSQPDTSKPDTSRPDSSQPEEAANDATASHPPAPAADAANPNFPANYQPPSPDEAPAPARTERLRSGGTRVIESDTPQTALTTVEPPRTHATTPAKPRPLPPSASASASTSAAAGQPSPSGSTSPLVVQIAAVSRREDAEVLSTALRKHGFSPMIRNGQADSFFHVQVGPFIDRTVAEATKEKLLSDGYNAILK